MMTQAQERTFAICREKLPLKKIVHAVMPDVLFSKGAACCRTAVLSTTHLLP